MPKPKNKYDFSGYATKNGLKCSDGRTILKDAFKHQDAQVVPLVWQHLHNEPSNVLGHAILENRSDGVYTYGKFNDTEAGKNAKELVVHGDIKFLSIYANELKQKGKDVLHGMIREVSLVLAGANPGALIDNVNIVHGDGTSTEVDDEAVIYTGLELTHGGEFKPDEKDNSDKNALEHDKDKTVQDVFNTLNEEQKNVVYALIAHAIAEGEEYVEHSNFSNKGGSTVKKNVFDKEDKQEDKKTLSHSQIQAIFADAQKCGSFKEAFLAHVATYGIENIDYLFPDAKTVTPSPELIKRDTEWVAGVISGTKHTPFSRIKSLAADLTADAARAKGYVKGSLKKEEVISLLKRITTPTTVYKKQKLDRDDIIDITDLDVVAWLKAEMRLMLDEELARAILVGDGRDAEDDDKINETNIRPIYTDDDLYAHHVILESDLDAEEIIDAILLARKNYKGSGSPALYTDTDTLMDMLLVKDTLGHRIYKTTTELAAALSVSKIIEVPVMEDLTRTITIDEEETTVALKGIIVNLSDYVMGADKGGAISMFDDFDIDYNQYKYLIETRCSGALIRPKSALVIEQIVAPPGE
jgi:hypothetical protein